MVIAADQCHDVTEVTSAAELIISKLEVETR